ncbi:hypothetical protein [Actinoplanes solisilvae]|uniref:hypothetical protein n=1 Tax=Actinoplanes solisilvae TaxID=2486853 RepID=UPI000FDBAD58|nr:hypothetical protein [Actinoplanes solisilvae]
MPGELTTQINPGYPVRIGPGVVGVGGDGQFGGDIDPEPPGIEQQRHRPDGASRVRHGPVQPHAQRRAATGSR